MTRTTPPLPCVLVEWLDAAHRDAAPCIDDLRVQAVVGTVCCSVGYLIRDDADGIVLAGEVNSVGDDPRLVTEIPRGLVRGKVRKLEVK